MIPRSFKVLTGVGVSIAVVLVIALLLIRGQEGRGVDAALPEARPNPEATDVDVRIAGSRAEPRVVRTRAGQIVRFRNEGEQPVRIEAPESARGDLRYQGLGSPVLEPGATHAFRPTETGAYRYRASTGASGVIEAQ